MENNMVKLDEILEAVKYKEAAKKKKRKRTVFSGFWRLSASLRLWQQLPMRYIVI